MDLQLGGKTAIITGGSRGIGKATARRLAQEGAEVAIVARGAEALAATADELSRETGRRILPVPADTGSDESVREMVRQVKEAFGRIDILVNGAATPGGQGPAPRMDTLTLDYLMGEMNVKVMGYLRTAREVAPFMREQGWGRIINLSGLAARQSGAIVGSMRNVSVAALTKNLADELGPHGINVTVVHPGMTKTEASVGVIAAYVQRRGVTPEEAEQRIYANNTIKRPLTADDIAAVITFLASPLSVSINGDAIAVGGGKAEAIYY